MAYYCLELPKIFKTWVEFLDAVKESGYDKTHVDIMIESPIYEDNGDSIYPERFKIKQDRFNIQFIKDMALEELLSTRMNKEDVIWYTKEVEAALFKLGHGQGNVIFKAASDVKRILLTLAPK